MLPRSSQRVMDFIFWCGVAVIAIAVFGLIGYGLWQFYELVTR